MRNHSHDALGIVLNLSLPRAPDAPGGDEATGASAAEDSAEDPVPSQLVNWLQEVQQQQASEEIQQ